MGLYPAEIDELSVRYFFDVLAWAVDKARNEEESRWRRSTLIATAVLNWGGDGRKEKHLGYIYKRLFGQKSYAGKLKTTFQKVRDMSTDEFRAALQTMKDRSKARQRRNR